MTNEERLLQVYQVERADQQNSSILNAAVVSVALAYIVTVAILLSDVDVAKQLGDFVLFAPFPVLSLNGYITIQVAAGMLRRDYLLHLEAQLATGSPVRAHPRFVALYHSLFLGAAGTLATILTLLTLVSPLVTSVAFTLYVIGPIAATVKVFWGMKLIVGIAYGILILLNVLVLVVVNRQVARGADRIKDGALQRIVHVASVWS